VTDIPDAVLGDRVDLFGAPGAPSVEEVAAAAETIPHEILCRIGPRVPRLHVGVEEAS